MSGKNKALAKVALAATALALPMLAAFVYGVVSVRRQNRPYRFARYLLRQEDKLHPRQEPARKGFWHRVATDRDGAAPSRQVAGELGALPYLAGYNAAPGVKDVTIYDEAAAWNGMNFLVSARTSRMPR